MADHLLDTNHLSPLVTLSHPLRQRVLAALQAEHTFAITVPVLVEMLFGVGVLPRAEQNQAEWQRVRCKNPIQIKLARKVKLKPSQWLICGKMMLHFNWELAFLWLGLFSLSFSQHSSGETGSVEYPTQKKGSEL